MKLSAGYINTVYSTCRYSGRSASNWEFLFLSFLGVEFTSELELRLLFRSSLLSLLYFLHFLLHSCSRLLEDSSFVWNFTTLTSLLERLFPPPILPPPSHSPSHPSIATLLSTLSLLQTFSSTHCSIIVHYQSFLLHLIQL